MACGDLFVIVSSGSKPAAASYATSPFGHAVPGIIENSSGIAYEKDPQHTEYGGDSDPCYERLGKMHDAIDVPMNRSIDR
jgi:hypothetical protein